MDGEKETIIMGAAEVICCFFLEEKIYTTDQKLVNTSTHAYLRCVCAGKQASAYTQPSRDRGKGTYIGLTRCVDGEGAADSHMFFFLKSKYTTNQKLVITCTHVPEICLNALCQEEHRQV